MLVNSHNINHAHVTSIYEQYAEDKLMAEKKLWPLFNS
jgi:hypothetical protein